MTSISTIQEHAEFIRRLAFSLLRDANDADDVVQQTFLTAIERPPSGSDRLKGWLGRVSWNHALRSAPGKASTLSSIGPGLTDATLCFTTPAHRGNEKRRAPEGPPSQEGEAAASQGGE